MDRNRVLNWQSVHGCDDDLRSDGHFCAHDWLNGPSDLLR